MNLYVSNILRHMTEDQRYSAEVVGRRIERLRNAYGLTQTDFAQRVGVLRESVSLWERGKQRPGIGPAQRIADSYNVTLDWIFLGRLGTLQFQMAQKLNAHEE